MVRKAIKPEYFVDFREIRSLRIKKKAEEVGVDVEEASLHSLSKHSGWDVLSNYIDNLVIDLDKYVNLQMEAGASFEDIGRNAVAVQLCKGELQKIINKVGDAKEAVEKEKTKG